MKQILLCLFLGTVASASVITFGPFGPLLSANADLTIPADYTGLGTGNTDSFFFSDTATVTGTVPSGPGNTFIAFQFHGLGSQYTDITIGGEASLSISNGILSIGGNTESNPSFGCNVSTSIWGRCILPITFGVPETLTINGSARSSYNTFELAPGDLPPQTILAEVSAQIEGVGFLNADGFNFIPDATLTFAPEPSTVSLAVLGLAALATRLRLAARG
jgi:hypothetical protein